MAGQKFLHLVKPFMAVLPEVTQSDRTVPFREKLLWTGEFNCLDRRRALTSCTRLVERSYYFIHIFGVLSDSVVRHTYH
jgi:hypothetical protein